MWESLFTPSSIQAALRIATPLMLAALGGSFTHHAGIFNIALEGMMLVGAFAAVTASYFTSSWIIAVVVTLCVGILFGLIYGLFTVTIKADFIVTGVAINLLSLGLTTYLLRALFHVKAGLQDPRIQALPDVNLPLLSSLGVIGKVVNDQSLFTYVSWLLVLLLWVLFYRMPFGMHLRAAGEHAGALETSGVSVLIVRYLGAVACGVLCALAGAHLSLGYLNQYVINVTSGRGFIALAAVLFANGNPVMVALVSLLFGLTESLSIRLQGLGVPGYFALMTPYAVTILALIFWSVRQQRRPRPAPEETLI